MITFLEQKDVPDLVIIALDNDLEMIPTPSGEWLDPGTGLDVAEWLASQSEPACPVVVNTTNTVYGDKMVQCLSTAGWQVARVIPHNDLEWIDSEWFTTMRSLIVDFAPSLATANKS